MSKAEFQKLRDEMKALKAAGKHEEFAKKFVAKDAIFMGPFFEPTNIEGMMAFGKLEEKHGKVEIEMKVDDVQQYGDTAVERSSLTLKRTEGEKTGWCLTVWVKEGGQWKIRNTCTVVKMPSPSA